MIRIDTMKKEILVYEKDRDVQKFLRAFFQEKPAYSLEFADKAAALKKTVRQRNPDAVIVGSPDGLRHLKSLDIACPVIAMIPRDGSDGIDSAMEADVGCYLLSPFDKEDLDYKLKVAVEGKGLVESLCNDPENLHALIELSSIISSTLDPKEILYLLVKKISELMDVTRCSMISISAENQRFGRVVSTFEDRELTGLKIELRKYPEIKRALSQKRVVVVKDAQSDPLMKEVREIIGPIGIRSIVVVPVIFRDEVIGTLLLRTSRAGRAFSREEVMFCSAIANASANALYNAFLYERLSKEKIKYERLAVTDYLTGIYNIRYFYKRLEEEFSRAERYRTALSCIMLDIDDFKKVNDRYGHRIGDIVLREFAQLVKRHTRKSDLLARYGGEEFVILLPQTPSKGAMVEAERLRGIVKEHQFKALKKGQSVTVSLGVASSPDKRIRNSDELIHRADNALFSAKETGRDQSILYSSL